MARRMEKSMTTLEQNKQTADGFGEKIKQIHQMLEEELLAGNNNQTWRTIRLAKYLLEDIQIERTILLADKKKVAKLEADLQFERNANYYNDYAKAKVENAELLKDKEMLDGLESILKKSDFTICGEAPNIYHSHTNCQVHIHSAGLIEKSTTVRGAITAFMSQPK